MYLVLFDCDGTLVDSQHHIVAAMEAAFSAHGLNAPERQRILSIVGLSLFEAVSELCKDHDQAPIDALAEAYKMAFSDIRASANHEPEPFYAGALDVLHNLKAQEDIIVGMATGKSRRGVDNIVRLHDLHGHFVTIQTADTSPSKPHPDMILRAMAETGVTPERTLMVGDTTYDMAMARAAGVPGLGVTWGYHHGDDLKSAGASQLIHSYDEFLPFLDGVFLKREGL